MSNLLKSKFFFGVMVLAIMFVGAFALTADAQTTTVVASGYTYSGVMKVGMSGPGISTLQAALNEVNMGTTVVVDGKFGPATLAAVKKFQMSKGLVADGVVGPATGAALTAATVAVITVPSNLPAGCTSNAGFSTTTGQSCAVPMTTLPAGCTSSAGYSSTTGAKCSTSGSSLPAGCTSTSGYSSTTGAKCSGSASNDDDELSGGETSISDINLNDADDDTLPEGADEAAVAELEFDVEDADAELVRVDVVFQSADNQVGTGAGEEEDPWEVFDTVYLLSDDGDVLAEEDASDEDNWDDADQIGGDVDADAHRIRLNVGEMFSEDESVSLWVAVDVASSVDGSDSNDAQWLVAVEEDGLRFTDSENLDTIEDADSDVAEFSIEEAGAQSEFTVSEASDSPDAKTLEVKENSSSTETIAIFNVDTDEDGGDVKINDFPVTLTIANTTTGDDMAEVVDDVFVVIDGVEYSADQSPSATDASQTFTFDDIEDDDIIVEAGDDMDVEVKVRFNSQGDNGANYASGTTIFAAAALTSNDVEDADSGDDIGELDGDATAETMTLAGNGIVVEVNSATTTVTEVDGVLNDTVTFSWDIDITSFGDDVYVNADFADVVQTADDAAGDVDMVYDIQSSDGTTTALDASDSGTITDTSGIDTVTGDTGAYGAAYNGETFYRIEDGETESFTITVTATNGNANKQVRAFLSEIEFTADNVDDASGDSDALTADIDAYTSDLADDSETPFKAVQ